MYSDGSMQAVGMLVKLVLFIVSFPILIWYLIYRKVKGKSNKWLNDWLFDLY